MKEIYEVILHEATPDDYEEYYNLRCDPTDIYWKGFSKEPDKEEHKKLYLTRLEKLSNSPADKTVKIYLIKAKVINEFVTVGYINLRFFKSTITIGISVSKDYQGYGIGTKAMSLTVNIAKKYDKDIHLSIRDDNISSRKMAEKCGFVPTEEFETANGLLLRIHTIKNNL